MTPNRPLLTLLLVTPVLAGYGAGTTIQPSAPVVVQQPRDPGAAASRITGSGSISGSVLVVDTGLPARRARVSLSGADLRGSRRATTDDLGRFVFAGLPAGRFTVSASKPGHVSVTYGQRRPGAGRPGTPIMLAENQRLEIQLHLPRGGVITGTVVDEHGEAIPGTPVRVLRYAMQNGERSLQQAGAGATDDRGIYRVYGLQPGEYVVAAVPRNAAPAANIERVQADFQAALERRPDGLPRIERALERAAAAQMAMVESAAENSAGYAPVYYPGTTAPAGAAAVNVGIGEEKAGIDFQLQLVRVAHVDGVVVTAAGPSARNVQVMLINVGHDVPGLDSATTRADAEGHFRLANVAPGQYMLVARAITGAVGRGGRGGRAGGPAILEGRGRGGLGTDVEATRLWAMTDIVVAGEDVSNLVLTLQPGMSVSGRIAFDGTTLQPPADLTRIRVNVTPVVTTQSSRQLATAATARVDASGRFIVSGVPPGRYRVTARDAGSGWVLGSSIVSAQDTLDFPVEVKAGQNITNAVLTFTDRVTEIAGTVINDENQPVPDYTIIVFPADRTFWLPQSRRVQSTRPATDGRFAFRNLPAGDYRIVPVLDPEPGSWYDPAFLQQLDAAALRVPLGEGEKKVQNLRIGGM